MWSLVMNHTSDIQTLLDQYYPDNRAIELFQKIDSYNFRCINISRTMEGWNQDLVTRMDSEKIILLIELKNIKTIILKNINWTIGVHEFRSSIGQSHKLEELLSNKSVILNAINRAGNAFIR